MSCLFSLRSSAFMKMSAFLLLAEVSLKRYEEAHRVYFIFAARQSSPTNAIY